MKKLIAAACMALLLMAGTAMADIAMPGSIATWNQYGQPGNQGATIGTGPAGIAASDMIRGSGLGVNTGGNSLNSNGWNGETTDYVQFGFTVAPGFHANLDKVYFASKVSSTGPNYLEVRTSLDDFSSALATIAQNKSTGTPYTNSVVDLSSLASIAGGNTFYVRFYGNGASSGSGTMRIGDYYDSATATYYFDSITGSVVKDPAPTPIPAAILLFGSGLAGLAGIRRKMSK